MENVWEAAKRVRKALAVVLAGAIVLGLSKVGVIVEAQDAEILVSFLVTSILVYLVPNAKDGLDG